MRPRSSAARGRSTSAASWHDVAIYAGERLYPGVAITGPAIVDYDHSETVLPPGTQASVDRSGNLLIALDGAV